MTAYIPRWRGEAKVVVAEYLGLKKADPWLVVV